MIWVLFIMWYCGPGCVDIETRDYADYFECQRYEVTTPATVAFCEKVVKP